MTLSAPDLIALIRKRIQSGECDLRDVGRLLTGRWDQDAPAFLLDHFASLEAKNARLVKERDVYQRADQKHSAQLIEAVEFVASLEAELAAAKQEVVRSQAQTLREISYHAAAESANEALRAALELARLWLANSLPVADIAGPKPLPVIDAALAARSLSQNGEG